MSDEQKLLSKRKCCPTCNGRGGGRSHRGGIWPDTQYWTCKTCGGKGTVPDDDGNSTENPADGGGERGRP